MLKESQVKIQKLFKKVSSWFFEYEKQVLLIIGFVIVSLASFVFGVLKGTELTQVPILVSKPSTEPIVNIELCDDDKLITQKDCVYVGSTKGTKYYPPSCSYAKKISKTNLRCFKSDADAIEKGYQKSVSCN